MATSGKVPRTPEVITNDWRTAIADTDVQNALRKQILDRHPVRTGNLDPGTGRPLAIAAVTDRRLPLLVVAGQILVRQEDVAKAKPLLGGMGFGDPQPIGCAGDGSGQDVTLPVVSFEKPGGTTDDLEAAITALIAEKINASFEHVLPDGGVKHGLATAAFVAKGPSPAKAAAPDAGMGVIVAVIDTGVGACVTKRTDDLFRNIVVGTGDTDLLNAINLAETPPSTTLDMGAGHGTFVTGVIRQIAPAADIRIYRALDSDGVGSEAGVACAILRAWRDGATIINLSLGQESYLDRPPVALQAALDLISDDVLVVAAAGNLVDPTDEDTATRPHWPAAFRRVVAVGALDQHGQPAPWSKRGAWVDVSTCGEQITSSYVFGTEEPASAVNPRPDTWPDTEPDPWASWAGTSFSAPQIVGLIAAAIAPTRYAQRVKPRQALANLMNAGHWYEDQYGVLVPSPLLP